MEILLLLLQASTTWFATAPVIDPVAKLGVRGGDKALRDLVAVELFAVAPESLKA